MANPVKTNELEMRNVDDQVLVHDTVHDKVHVLNGTAGMVLNMCDGTRSSTDIARALSEATGTDIGLVLSDVEAIVRDFASLQLVENQS